MGAVQLVGLEKSYPGPIHALAGVDLEARANEILVIVGPSGSGKSTLLRLVAGLDEPTRGEIRIGGRSVRGLAPWQRGVGMVFQEPAVYPHLNVAGNLAFSLKARGIPRDRIRERVEQVAPLLGLSAELDRKVDQLSGGQRQRVALGRALVRGPEVLLLDEPLSGLDAPLRASMREDLALTLRRLGVTTILVTHDQAEAMALGDRIALLDSGRILQCDQPARLYQAPSRIEVARFIGRPPMDLLPVDVEATENGMFSLQIAGGSPLQLDRAAIQRLSIPVDPIRPLWMGLRPEFLSLGHSATLRLNGVVRHREREGVSTLLRLHLLTPTATIVHARCPNHSAPEVGSPIDLDVEAPAVCWFDRSNGQRIPTASHPA